VILDWNSGKFGFNAANDSDVPVEDRYQLLIDAVPDYAIFMLDDAGRVASWNSGVQKIKGYTPEEIIGRHFSIFYTPEDVAADKPGRELALATAPGRAEDRGWRVRRDGSRFWADVTITAVYDSSGALVGFAKITRDMTERMRLAELEHANELSTQMQAAREDEQRRIARELHDDLGQQLTALKMGVAALEQQIVPGATNAPQRQIDNMLASLRRIAADLRPPMLDDLGLGAALEWLTDDFTQRFHVKVALRLAVDDSAVTPFASATIYRIVQEALTNVARHAQASEVTIDMSNDAHGWRLGIEDNGRGTLVEEACAPGSLGLLGMRERVRQLRGTLTIDSAPGMGFRIVAHIPLGGIRLAATSPD
jgi:PAS domain S-box-containing protein